MQKRIGESTITQQLIKNNVLGIQPEKTLTGAVKGVTVEQVKELKAAVIRGAADADKL